MNKMQKTMLKHICIHAAQNMSFISDDALYDKAAQKKLEAIFKKTANTLLGNALGLELKVTVKDVREFIASRKVILEEPN